MRPHGRCRRRQRPRDGRHGRAGRERRGFAAGMRAYIRNPTGDGEFFRGHVGRRPRPRLGKSAASVARLSRRSAACTRSTSAASTSIPGDGARARARADAADRRRSRRNRSRSASRSSICSISCSAIARPATSSVCRPRTRNGRSVDARHAQRHRALRKCPDRNGNYYRRTVAVNVKPRNLLPK